MASASASIATSATRRPPPSALVPGLAVSLIVSAIAVAGGAIEERTLGRAIIEPLVLAILVGMVVRTVRGESVS
jgi:uncharacterized membrane protein YadS